MIIRDSDCVNADLQMPKFDWTVQICNIPSFLLILYFGFLDPLYFLKFLVEHRAPALTFYLGSFSNPWDLQDLLQSNTAFGLDILLVYTLGQNNFWNTLSFLKCSMYQLSFQHLWMHIIICICIYNVQEFSNILKNFQKTNITC